MAAIVDALFRHSKNVMKTIEELVEQKEMFDEIYKKDLVKNMMI